MQGDTRSFWGWDVGTFGNHSSVPHRCFPRRPHRGEGSALGLGAHLICKFIGATPGTEPQRGGGPVPASTLPWGPSACVYAALGPQCLRLRCLEAPALAVSALSRGGLLADWSPFGGAESVAEAPALCSGRGGAEG